MSWSNVIILVNTLDFDEAKQKALDVFETEGTVVCDGQYELDTFESGVPNT